MKKWIASVLSAVIVFSSVFAGLSAVMASASASSDTDPDFTYIDFDNKTYNSYADTNSGMAKAYVELVDSGDKDHGKVIKFTQLSSQANKLPQTVAVLNYDGSSRLQVKKGEKYTISIDYNVVQVSDALQFVARFVPASSGAANAGSMNEAREKSALRGLMWVDKAVKGKGWRTGSMEFEAPADGTMLISFMVYGSDINGQEIYLDNIKLERKITADGSSFDVVYDYNYNNTVETQKAFLGSSYAFASRSGYVFGGWYVDKEFTVPAPSTARKSCTKLYAKWTVDNRVAQTTVNTYDDSGIAFTTTDGKDYSFNKVGESTKTDFSSYGPVINTTAFNTSVLHFTKAYCYEFQWPAIARIYDSVNKTGKFEPNAGSVYEISLKYRVDKAPRLKTFLQIMGVGGGIGNPNGAYNASNIYVKSLAEITEVTDGWVTAKATFTAPNSNALCITLVNSANWQDKLTDLEIYVDDITVTERLDAYSIYFDTRGGDTMSAVNCLSGSQLPTFSTPKREGYCFTGWYTNSDCTKSLTSTVMPNKDLILYAGWVSLENTPDSLVTGFEEDEYDRQVYINDGTSTPVSNNSMTDSVLWHKDDAVEAYDGKGYITFDDGITNITNSRSERLMAVTLYNPDGTPFCVKEGQRYKVSLAYRHSGSAVNIDTRFAFLISDQSPIVGVNLGNSTALCTTDVLGADKHDTQNWGEYSTYVTAATTGTVKLVMYGSKADQVLDVDNVSIKLMSSSECVKVEYFQQKPDGSNQYACGTRLGAPGDLLVAGDSATHAGYTFDGWRTAEGEIYSSNVFPSSDLKLYASWREIENATPTPNSKEEILVDFEDTDKTKAFYEDASHNYHPKNGVFLMVNDPDNAHSGNNYFKFYQCGHWSDDYLRRFKLYDPDTVGNQIYLEPNSVYKVSFWLNIEEVGAGNLYLTTFPNIDNTDDYEVASENYITDTNSFEKYGQWVRYENTVVTGDDEDGDGIAATLGFTLYGGYLTACLDDVSVIKLKEVTVSFDSKGGNEVDEITQLSYDYAIAPEDPTREGYEFTGWYTDEALTNRFDFTTNLVTANVKLYAGWKVAEKPAEPVKEPIYNTVVEYETVESTVEVEVPDKELDEKVTVADNDKIGKVNKANTTKTADDGNNIALIIIAIAGGVLVVAAAAVVTVLVIKKRKRS